MEDLAERLRASGHCVIAASPYRNGWARAAHMLWTTVSRRRDYRIAVVDLYSGRAFFWGEGVCRVLSLLRKPHVLVLRGGNLPAFARRRSARVGRVLKSASAVTAPSRYLLEEMKRYREDVRLLPNPLALEAYPFRLRPRPRPRLVWVRAFHEIYNPSLAVRVLASLAKEFDDASLVMVGRDKGDGSFQRARRLAAALGVAERVRFPGGVPKSGVPRWLDEGDIFLNTTNIDNTPVSVLEAMACGLPVVSTDVGGLPYLLESGRDALLVPPGDAEAMADAVRRVLTEPGLAERLSRGGRERAELFDWPVVMAQWEHLLGSLEGTGAA